jgi:hypothetical protein
MAEMSVQILHTGGHYRRYVEGFLKTRGARVESLEISDDENVALDDAPEILPESVGECDILIAIAVPPGVLRALPEILSDAPCRGLIIPVEDPNWVRPGLQRQMERLCGEQDIECAVPMPFCSLVPRSDALREFCDRYSVGRPRVDLQIEDGEVVSVECHSGAACGLTHAVARQLPGTPAEEVIEEVKKLHHGRPCMASMVLVPQRGDTLMHVSLDIIKRAFKNALRRARGESVLKNPP